MEKNMIWRFDNILEWIRFKIHRTSREKVDAGGYDWSLIHFCANNNFQSYLKQFAKTIYHPNEMEKNMIWRFANILEWIRNRIKRK